MGREVHRSITWVSADDDSSSSCYLPHCPVLSLIPSNYMVHPHWHAPFLTSHVPHPGILHHVLPLFPPPGPLAPTLAGGSLSTTWPSLPGNLSFEGDSKYNHQNRCMILHTPSAALNAIQIVWLELIQSIFLTNIDGCKNRSYAFLRSTVTVFS